LPKAINYLNNYLIYFIRKSDSSKWKLVPLIAILLEKIESRPFIKSKHPIRENKETLKKGDTVYYLFANVKYKGNMKN